MSGAAIGTHTHETLPGRQRSERHTTRHGNTYIHTHTQTHTTPWLPPPRGAVAGGNLRGQLLPERDQHATEVLPLVMPTVPPRGGREHLVRRLCDPPARRHHERDHRGRSVAAYLLLFGGGDVGNASALARSNHASNPLSSASETMPAGNTNSGHALPTGRTPASATHLKSIRLD